MDTDTIKWSLTTEASRSAAFRQDRPHLLSQSWRTEKCLRYLRGSTSIRDSLLATLQDHSALWAFSRTVKEHGLARKCAPLPVASRGHAQQDTGANVVNIDWREDWLRAESEWSSHSEGFNLRSPIHGDRQCLEGSLKL